MKLLFIAAKNSVCERNKVKMPFFCHAPMCNLVQDENTIKYFPGATIIMSEVFDACMR